MEHFKLQANQKGYSLISMLIGIMLMGVLLAGSMALLSRAETKTSNASEDAFLDNLSRAMNVISVSIERGGPNSSQESIARGIMICAIDGQSGNCGRYRQQTTNICIASPVLSNEQAEGSFEVRGVRHRNGLMQTRNLSNVDLQNFNLSNFCRDSNQWESLHSANDFTIDRFQLCRYDGKNLDSIFRNYASQCQSVLINRSNEAVPQGQFLISIYQIRPKQLGHSGETYSRILRLYNAPSITTL